MKKLRIFCLLVMLGMFGLCSCGKPDNEVMQKQLEELREQNEELSNRLDAVEKILATIKTPTPEPTKAPTPEPTKAPTPEPTKTPIPEPTKTPTPEPIKQPVPNDIEFHIDYNGAIPPETGTRKLTETQLNELAYLKPEQAAKTISTLADAYAWLKQEGYSTSGANLNGWGDGTTFELNNARRGKELAWEEMSTTINVLLEGDYDEVGTLLCTLVPDEAGWAFFYSSFNYVKKDGWYYITDPVCHISNTGYPFCRTYTIKTNTLKGMKEILSEINIGFCPISIVAYPIHTDRIVFQVGKDPVSVSILNVPEAEYIFRAGTDDLTRYEKEKEQAREEEMAAWKSTARQINIDNYGMPSAIGKRTLDYDAAVALVGKDPKVIADSVKSVADVLQYMVAARFGYYSEYYGTPWYDFWGFDAPGDYQISENYGCCCAGYANAVSYLLQGDYEKVGTLQWVGGGNHTISWVYTNGKYYVFDFTQYCSGGNYNRYDCPLVVLDRLEDFYDNMPAVYSEYMKSEVVIMVAFETGEAMYPSSWQDPPYFTGLTFPEEARGKITLIYQKDPRYGLEYKKVDTDIPGWNVP